MSAIALAVIAATPATQGVSTGWGWFWLAAAIVLLLFLFGYKNRNYQQPTTFASSIPEESVTEGQWESLQHQIQRIEERLDDLENRTPPTP